MNTIQIEEILIKLIKVGKFGGVRASDCLPWQEEDATKYFVINTDPSHMPGQHWVALYLGQTPEFFDSLGKSPACYDKDLDLLLINYGPNYIYNGKRIQNYDSNVCGQYCIFYVILRDLGYSMREIVNMFNDELKLNDEIVSNFYSKIDKRVN